MVLVGPSGCGKSTALRMLAGLEDITAGEIKIDDQVVNEMPPRDRDVAMVFQSYALYPHMSVFDNMGFGLKMRGSTRSEITSRVKEAGRILRLDQLLARKPRQLSGGQRQRVAVGRAIVRQPRVFLLDEPLSNLDAMLRVQTRIELQKMHQRLGTTFIYVTHDQVEAMTMGDRIAVMKDGVLQQVAPPREIYDQPVNMYVAGVIGSPRMNFLPDTLSDHQAQASGLDLNLPTPPGAVLAPRARVGRAPSGRRAAGASRGWLRSPLSPPSARARGRCSGCPSTCSPHRAAGCQRSRWRCSRWVSRIASGLPGWWDPARRQ